MPAPNPHVAIDRLAAVRRRMCALALEEEALARRVFGLPDGRHGGIACSVDISTGADRIRRIVVAEDVLAGGWHRDAPDDGAFSPAQME